LAFALRAWVLFLVGFVLKLDDWCMDWIFVGEYHGREGEKEGANIETTIFDVWLPG